MIQGMILLVALAHTRHTLQSMKHIVWITQLLSVLCGGTDQTMNPWRDRTWMQSTENKLSQPTATLTNRHVKSSEGWLYLTAQTLIATTSTLQF